MEPYFEMLYLFLLNWLEHERMVQERAQKLRALAKSLAALSRAHGIREGNEAAAKTFSLATDLGFETALGCSGAGAEDAGLMVRLPFYLSVAGRHAPTYESLEDFLAGIRPQGRWVHLGYRAGGVEDPRRDGLSTEIDAARKFVHTWCPFERVLYKNSSGYLIENLYD